jgi:aminopeptidase
MGIDQSLSPEPGFARWIPLAKQVVRRSLGLRWDDVLEIYSYTPTIPLAEALAMEARRAGSDTHITLMTDDLWFTSMRDLHVRWLRAPSKAELAINKTITASIYLGGPRDARRMRDIPPEKFSANAIGNMKQDKPRRRRGVRHLDLPIGRVCPERAEAYGLDYERWERSYNAALAVDLKEIRRAGLEWHRKLAGKRKIRISSPSGTDLRFQTKAAQPMVDDGIISASDVRRGFAEASLPAGKIVSAISPDSADGVVLSTDPVFLMGRPIKGLSLRFAKGVLVEWSALGHAELLDNLLQNRRAGGNRMGWFSIGLNPAPEPCMLDNSIVQNYIGIGLGPHPILELTKAKQSDGFETIIGIATVEILN